MRGNRFFFFFSLSVFSSRSAPFFFFVCYDTDGNVLPWLHDRGLRLDDELERARSHMDLAHSHVRIDDRESSRGSVRALSFLFGARRRAYNSCPRLYTYLAPAMSTSE